MGKTLKSSFYSLLFFFLLICLFFWFCTSTTASFGVFRCSLSARPDFYIQDFGKRVEEKMAFSLFTARRILSGPGSSPPHCTSKCGSCTPCKPVHVPVPPGTPVTAEYYPEAWRCKCGNKLYMP